MAETREPLYLFECCGAGKHRIYRKDSNNRSGCSRCGNSFKLIAKLPRNEGETEVQHHIRTLAYKPKRVN